MTYTTSQDGGIDIHVSHHELYNQDAESLASDIMHLAIKVVTQYRNCAQGYPHHDPRHPQTTHFD